jgi:arylsulfatase
MAAYAGFLEHTDAQIGRLVQFLEDNGRFDNTAVFLLSDNGGAPEAGPAGRFEHPYRGRMTVGEMFERLDALGSRDSQPLYLRAWAMTSSAPFKYYRPYRGGVQTPFIVSWPAGICMTGLRTQFVDVIDITPTVLDITGIDAPAGFDGVCQMPIQGKSIRATFNDPKSPNPRNTQYHELWGSRSIYHDGWKAIAIHVPGTEFDDDRWELYDVATDFSESVNLASQYPERVEAMKKLWWSEAAKHGALPLLEAPGGRRRTYDQSYGGPAASTKDSNSP